MASFFRNTIINPIKYIKQSKKCLNGWRNKGDQINKMVLPVGQQIRWLNLHEYQSLEILKEHGIPVPMGKAAFSPEEADAVFKEIRGSTKKDVVIKAQALTGGRGLGHFKSGLKGGVHVCTKSNDAKRYAEQMIGQTLVTKQTGERGMKVNRVLLVERVYMRREMYFSILMDRHSQCPVLVASPCGGTSIEDVAAATPEKIFKEPVDITKGPTQEQLLNLAKNMGVDENVIPQTVEVIKNLYDMFINVDATLVEINPMAETPDGRVLACDCKLTFDDNAEFRQHKYFDQRDKSQEDPREVEAAKYALNYIGLDGNIGCLVNGAGLAMATMDVIKHFGGEPANFLDVGGGATESQVKKAFEILNTDNKVKSILVNIFGGIMRCDVIAAGVIAAARDLGLRKPIVIRLQGTNVEKARELIEQSGFRMIIAYDIDDAAEKAVKIASIVDQAEKVHVNVTFELPL